MLLSSLCLSNQQEEVVTDIRDNLSELLPRVLCCRWGQRSRNVNMKAFMVHYYGNEWHSISVYPAARGLKYFPEGLETGWCVSCRVNIGNLAARTETRGAKSLATFLSWLQMKWLLKKNRRWHGKKKKKSQTKYAADSNASAISDLAFSYALDNLEWSSL